MLLLVFVDGMVSADEPRTLLKRTPRILGREIEQLVLVVPIHLGRQMPGMLTMPEYDILPNRFVAASEDSDRVYYQAVARFRPQALGACARCGMDGGLSVSKTRGDLVVAYTGDARDPRVSLNFGPSLESQQIRGLKVGHSERYR
jgi:hypothetical protein